MRAATRRWCRSWRRRCCLGRHQLVVDVPVQQVLVVVGRHRDLGQRESESADLRMVVAARRAGEQEVFRGRGRRVVVHLLFDVHRGRRLVFVR